MCIFIHVYANVRVVMYARACMFISACARACVWENGREHCVCVGLRESVLVIVCVRLLFSIGGGGGV